MSRQPIRRVDWSPDEWIAGTFGLLTMNEAAVYMAVLMQIYSRGGECPNDVEFIARHFKWKRPHRQAEVAADSAPHKVTALALARLIEIGKLHVTPDGQWLTNGRADRELNRARERISGTVRAGIASGRARRAKSPTRAPHEPHTSPVDTSKSSQSNDLDRTRVRITNYHYDSESDLKISTEAARDPARDAGAPGRAPTAPAKPKPSLQALAAEARRKFLKGE